MRRSVWLMLAFACSASAENPRNIDAGPGVTKVRTLEQNWSHEESNWFYNVAQGSRLLPYDWFLHLEQAESTELFRSGKHIRDLGYIPRTPDPGNPDGLPIGFIKDAPYPDGTPGLGITCAACHTNEITFNKTAFIVDGAPTMGDFERFLKELLSALSKTASDNGKFERFAASVLPAGASDADKALLREHLGTLFEFRAAYNERNLPAQGAAPFGPGRVDAFGAIFNEVSVTFLGIPENHKPANAPVSYPCLWDAPQHDRVQWNGAAENRVSLLGEKLFRTKDVGALGRNAGEVLGVFGNADVNHSELFLPRPYDSTVNRPHLIEIEESLKSLWSPQWPEDALGMINPVLRDKGAQVYKDNCASCHQPITRTDPKRKVVAQISNVGTDQKMIENFTRKADTGRLRGRRKTLLGLDRFSRTEPVAAILKHVVERVILDPDFNLTSFREVLAAARKEAKPLDLLDALNPGYRMTATIKVGDERLQGQFDSLDHDGKSLSIDGGRFRLLDKASAGLESAVLDFRSPEGFKRASESLKGLVSKIEENKTRIEGATSVEIGYKARPLNGVWATAPYLHNGSVPNLVELLKPASGRVKTFHVGSREFDPENVGFKDDPNMPLFDTTVEGNSNAGHEYGAALDPVEKKQLLEYLKSL